MDNRKAAGAFGPHGLVESVATSFYSADPKYATSHTDILPWQHVSIGLALAAERIVRKWPVSRPVARAYAELNGLGGRG